MVGGVGMPELIIILTIVVILFGANKLPQIGRGLGEGIRNFKGASKELSGGSEGEKSGKGSVEEKKESDS